MTIYVPIDIILRERTTDLITAVIQCLDDAGYEQSGSITGDKSITDAVHYRYAYDVPTPLLGIPKGKDEKYRRSNDGSYNIDDNPDIIQAALHGDQSVTTVLEAVSKRS